ncbi:adenylate kinase-domain-containing protein [Flagelloscypha sp. PMI_526]|nr:adenylate kinase-domain-containing protein [Flagelloscypha sp. PMI_526]
MRQIGSLHLRQTTNPGCRHFSQSSSARSLKFLKPRAQEDEERLGAKMLRMIMFGKPGAGKGTLSNRLVQQYDILSLSTGDLLRQHILERTPIGVQAEGIVAAGGFLSDELMLEVVTSKLKALKNKHWILDGFPRTLGQAELLDVYLRAQGTPLSLVINLDVPDEAILSRISDRYVHLKSGRVYNLSFNPPKTAGFDDVTGEPLTKRPDDNPEVFVKRLEKFYASTSPLISYYSTLSNKSIPDTAGARRRQLLHPHQLTLPQTMPTHRLVLETLSGSTSNEIWPHLQALVKRNFPALKERPEYIEARRQNSLSDSLNQVQGSLAGLRTPMVSVYK